MDDNEREMLAVLAKLMALVCVRNTQLENIHAGIVPVTCTGDYSDVVVVDADGRRIPWTEVSHFDDDAMRDLMRQVVDRLYTFHALIDDPDFQTSLGLWQPSTRAWDEPKMDANLMVPIGGLASRRGAGDDED